MRIDTTSLCQHNGDRGKGGLGFVCAVLHPQKALQLTVDDTKLLLGPTLAFAFSFAFRSVIQFGSVCYVVCLGWYERKPEPLAPIPACRKPLFCFQIVFKVCLYAVSFADLLRAFSVGFLLPSIRVALLAQPVSTPVRAHPICVLPFVRAVRFYIVLRYASCAARDSEMHRIACQ